MRDTSQEERSDTDETDIRLMQLVGTGDQQALRMLITRWQDPLINFFYRSVRSVQTAEDLAQSVFIRIHRNAHSYQPQARFTTYIFHIARNLLINELRRVRRKPAELYDPTGFAPEICGDDESQRRCAEIEEAFAAAIVTLTENQRTALLLHKQQDLSYEEIAAVMETSMPLVKAWIFRGRQKLRETLKDFLNPRISENIRETR
ncbi:MAG: RNA polymerase sigma factor [Puniceicoccales bacterium]|jgi:RNA polymerase sigma-70 factor (ECF subfamily)|nr:RNA polymerase sigma factor [Puniceicoccales bacterium]